MKGRKKGVQNNLKEEKERSTHKWEKTKPQPTSALIKQALRGCRCSFPPALKEQLAAKLLEGAWGLRARQGPSASLAPRSEDVFIILLEKYFLHSVIAIVYTDTSMNFVKLPTQAPPARGNERSPVSQEKNTADNVGLQRQDFESDPVFRKEFLFP